MGEIIGWRSTLARKIQIQNPNLKMVGDFRCRFAFVMCGAEATAQQPTKFPRIGYLSNSNPDGESARPREFGWLCASVVTLKDKTSPSNTDIRTGISIGSLSLRPSWCASRLILSGRRRARWGPGGQECEPRRFPS